MPEKELIESIIARIAPAVLPDISAKISEGLAAHEAACKGELAYRSEYKEEFNRHAKAVAEIESRFGVIRRACPHYVVAVGRGCGYDRSVRTCEACKKEL